MDGVWADFCVTTRPRPKAKGPRPKAQDPRPKAQAQGGEISVSCCPDVARGGRTSRRQGEVASSCWRGSSTAAPTPEHASLPYLRFPRTLVQARGGDMPRGMAGAWHVTRGPIPRGPKNGMGDRASHSVRSPGGLLGRYRPRSPRLRQNGGQRRTEGDSPIFAAAALPGCGTSHMPRKLGQSPCPSGSRKPRIAKELLAVARIRAYLPAALVVERISIRPHEARTDEEIRPTGSGPTW